MGRTGRRHHRLQPSGTDHTQLHSGNSANRAKRQFHASHTHRVGFAARQGNELHVDHLGGGLCRELPRLQRGRQDPGDRAGTPDRTSSVGGTGRQHHTDRHSRSGTRRELHGVLGNGANTEHLVLGAPAQCSDVVGQHAVQLGGAARYQLHISGQCGCGAKSHSDSFSQRHRSAGQSDDVSLPDLHWIRRGKRLLRRFGNDQPAILDGPQEYAGLGDDLLLDRLCQRQYGNVRQLGFLHHTDPPGRTTGMVIRMGSLRRLLRRRKHRARQLRDLGDRSAGCNDRSSACADQDLQQHGHAYWLVRQRLEFDL